MSFAIILIISITIIVNLSNPLRKSEQEIRNMMLDIIPIGTNMNDVINIIEKNNLEIDWIDNDNGYRVDKKNQPGMNRDFVVGKKYIRVYLGEYRNIFITDVTAYIGFDENSELIDIAIRKDTDSL